jgi:sugar fermentation stimulation protein A
VALFVIQRTDCDAFSAAGDLDPAFAAALERAADTGVDVLCYACHMDISAVRIAHRIDWRR